MDYVPFDKVWEMTGGPIYNDTPGAQPPVTFDDERQKDLRIVGLRKTKATIFWRPTLKEDKGSYKYDKDDIDWDKINELFDKMEKWFPKLKFKDRHRIQTHDQSCSYEPY